MISKRMLATAVVILIGTTLSAAEMVGVPGSGKMYPSQIEGNINGKSVLMELTGTALRSKFLINVYTIGSYVQQGVTVHSAEEVAAADCAKRLHLQMERNVDGKDMAEAFRTAIRANHPEPEFNDEVNRLVEFMRDKSANKGDHILLTHIPGVGLHINVAGKFEFVIRNVAFAHAIWEIYLGKNNLGEAIKKSLVSRL